MPVKKDKPPIYLLKEEERRNRRLRQKRHENCWPHHTPRRLRGTARVKNRKNEGDAAGILTTKGARQFEPEIKPRVKDTMKNHVRQKKMTIKISRGCFHRVGGGGPGLFAKKANQRSVGVRKK